MRWDVVACVALAEDLDGVLLEALLHVEEVGQEVREVAASLRGVIDDVAVIVAEAHAQRLVHDQEVAVCVPGVLLERLDEVVVCILGDHKGPDLSEKSELRA